MKTQTQTQTAKTQTAKTQTAKAASAKAASAKAASAKAASATKPAQATKPIAKASSMFATIGAALLAHGLTPSGNCSSHAGKGRVTANNFKSAMPTQTGKTFFATRDTDIQDGLKKIMLAHIGKPFAINDKDGKPNIFIPMKNPDAKLSHAPQNPGSFQTGIVRAWFAQLIQVVQTGKLA